MPLEPYYTYTLPHSPWKQAPLLPYALLLIAGITIGYAGRQLLPPAGWAAITTGFALLSTGLCLWGKGAVARRLATGIAYAALMAAGGTLTCLSYKQVEVKWPDTPRTWQAEVLSVREKNAYTLRADVRLIAPQTPYHGRKVRIKLAQINTASPLTPADRLTFYAPIRPGYRAGNPGDFDYRSYLLTHGICGTATPDSCWKMLPPNHHPDIAMQLLRYRQQLLNTYSRHFQAEALAILSALTLGDKSALTDNTRRLFSETGTSHVLALSGLHLGILFSLLQLFALRWIRKRPVYLAAQGFSILALWLFVGLAGSPLSLQRAAWMLTLFLLGNSMQRTRQATLNNLALAALILLICSPLSLFDVGFQLSFCAVLSIILGNQYFWQHLPVPNWSNQYERQLFPVVLGSHPPRTRQWWALQRVRLRLRLQKYAYLLLRQVIYPFICVSLSAQFGTALLIIFYFHTFSPYAVLANFVVIPAAYVLLGGALLFFTIPCVEFQTWLVKVLTLTVDGMTTALDHIAHWPGATLTLYPHALTLCLLSVLPVLLFKLLHSQNRQQRRQAITLATLLLVACIGIETYRLRPQRLAPQIMVYNLPRTTAIHFIQSAQCSYLFSPIAPDTLHARMVYIEKNFFTPRGMATPQPVVKTDMHNHYLLRKGNYFVFGTTRLLLLHHNLPAASTQRPQAIDLLVVGYGSYETLATVQRHFSPRHVVLDPTLPTRRRNLWLTACAAANIPCHDVRNDGAFVYLLKPKP